MNEFILLRHFLLFVELMMDICETRSPSSV